MTLGLQIAAAAVTPILVALHERRANRLFNSIISRFHNSIDR